MAASFSIRFYLEARSTSCHGCTKRKLKPRPLYEIHEYRAFPELKSDSNLPKKNM